MYYYINYIFISIFACGILDILGSILKNQEHKKSILNEVTIQMKLMDASEDTLEGYMNDVFMILKSAKPYCVQQISKYIDLNSVVIKIKYLNQTYNIQYISDLIEDAIYTCKDKCQIKISYDLGNSDAIISCVFMFSIILSAILINIYHVTFRIKLNKGLAYLANLIGIIVALITSVTSLVYFEKYTQLITLAINQKQQLNILLQYIIFNFIFMIVFSIVILCLQNYKQYDNDQENEIIDEKENN